MTDLQAEAHARQAAPRIGVCVNQATSDDALTPLLWGMEEEGVPAAVERCPEIDPLALAQRAARSSRLGVGVGLSLGYAVVTTDKLPAQRLYLALAAGTPQQIRTLGANAARLVRRVPLKEVVVEGIAA